MTEIVLSVSRHQSHCVFSVEFVVFQCRLEEDMLDALIVAFYSYYNSGMVRWWKSKRYTGLCDCGFSRNTRPRQVFSFESNPIQVNFWIVYMHGYRCIQTIFFSSCCSCSCCQIMGIVLGMPAEQPNSTRYWQQILWEDGNYLFMNMGDNP